MGALMGCSRSCARGPTCMATRGVKFRFGLLCVTQTFRELRNIYHHHPESQKRESSERNSGSIHLYGRHGDSGKPSKIISTIAILWPVRAIFEKRAAMVEVDTSISPDIFPRPESRTGTVFSGTANGTAHFCWNWTEMKRNPFPRKQSELEAGTANLSTLKPSLNRTGPGLKRNRMVIIEGFCLMDSSSPFRRLFKCSIEVGLLKYFLPKSTIFKFRGTCEKALLEGVLTAYPNCVLGFSHLSLPGQAKPQKLTQYPLTRHLLAKITPWEWFYYFLRDLVPSKSPCRELRRRDICHKKNKNDFLYVMTQGSSPQNHPCRGKSNVTRQKCRKV